MIAGAVVAVFMYHHVSATAGGGPFGRALTVSPQEFDGQLRALRERHCAVVGVDELVRDVRAGRMPGCEVALTFDDGYDDAASVAAPMLRRYGDVGTFFVTTGYLGTRGHMTVADVRTLAAEGMDIGAHTVNHPDLTRLAPRSVAQQVVASRAMLRSISGQAVGSFAYPAGRHDSDVEAQVRAAGYDVAFSTDPGRVDAVAIARDRFALPRYRVLRGRGDALFQSVLGSSGAPAQGLTGGALLAVAKSRSEGNAPDTAERVAVALLSVGYPEQILKVRVFATKPAVVAGIMLSGVKFHAPVDRETFAADAADMIYRAFAAEPSVTEVDIWAVVPIAVARDATVSGDLAVPTTRTVFSASVLRSDWDREEGTLGTTYWEAGWLQHTTR